MSTRTIKPELLDIAKTLFFQISHKDSSSPQIFALLDNISVIWVF